MFLTVNQPSLVPIRSVPSMIFDNVSVVQCLQTQVSPIDQWPTRAFLFVYVWEVSYLLAKNLIRFRYRCASFLRCTNIDDRDQGLIGGQSRKVSRMVLFLLRRVCHLYRNTTDFYSKPSVERRITRSIGFVVKSVSPDKTRGRILLSSYGKYKEVG